MVAKLSSESIIAAASLDTSVPVIPMATPMSAFLSAGASLTPSPVMATILPFFCHASTILILFSGDTLAYTDIFVMSRASSSSDRASSSSPVSAMSPSSYIPICFAMATAVILWSPVIMTGFMPARLASATAATDSGRGGSTMDTSPRNVNPYSVSTPSTSSLSLYANDSTRRPFSENALF